MESRIEQEKNEGVQDVDESIPADETPENSQDNKTADAEDEVDARLMLAASQDDLKAFEKLVVRHQQHLLNFFVRCGVYTDAEDLVQQTFVRLYRYRHRYERRAKFTTFLYLLARQVRVDEIRKRVRIQRIKDQAKVHKEELGSPAHDTPRDGLLIDVLQKALDQLSENHREVIVLGVLQELPYAEISAILEVPIGTVKSRMFHALREMRKLLKNEP